MKIEFERNVVPASEQNIRDFEAKYGLELPEAYKKFLCLYNGGCPTPSAFSYGNEAGENESEVRQFLGLGSNDEDNLEDYLNLYSERLPDGAFPIAYDDFGNLVCLNLNVPAAPVLFWDHETEGENATIASILFPIADDFASFCEMLY